MEVITIDSDSDDEPVLIESSDSETEFGQGQDENLLESKNRDYIGRNFEQLSPKNLVQLMQKQILEVQDIVGVSCDCII